VTVGRGQTVRVALPLPPSLAERESRADDRDGPPWLLIGVGVGLVVVGVVIAIAIALATTSGNGMNEPISDPVWGVTMALR
jgi:hypothetical protein